AADDDDIRAAGAAVGQQLHLVGGTGDDRDVIDVAEQLEEDEIEFEVDGQQHLGHHCSPPAEVAEGAPTTDRTLCPSRAASTSDRSPVPTNTSMRAPSPVPKLPTSRLIWATGAESTICCGDDASSSSPVCSGCAHTSTRLPESTTLGTNPATSMARLRSSSTAS